MQQYNKDVDGTYTKETSGQSNLTTGHIAATHERFNGIHQSPGGVMLSWAHPSPNPKQRIDQFNHFCTAYRRESRAKSGEFLVSRYRDKTKSTTMVAAGHIFFKPPA